MSREGRHMSKHNIFRRNYTTNTPVGDTFILVFFLFWVSMEGKPTHSYLQK